jgi:glycosyltransferase involved in cell wall biosynthesis
MKISVIIPTFNNSKFLKIAIQSVVDQTLNHSQYEIIVVDNDSTDDTKKVFLKIEKSNPEANLKYFHDIVPGQLTGRHRGAHEAKGDILVYTDEDIIADKNWLRSIEGIFQDSSVMLVCGKSLPNYEADPPEWLESFWHRNGDINNCFDLSLMDLGNDLAEVDPIFVIGLNFSIRKSALFELGGFHPDAVPKKYQKYQGGLF